MLRTVLCLALATLAAAAEDAWTVAWKAASDAAAKAKQPILANFTGSDWCEWCVKLKEEVFRTPEFAAWAKGRVVLLEVDIPRESKLSEAQLEANQALVEKYSIDGFPTILILSAEGKELGRLGYKQGGPQVWTAAAQAIIDAAR
jgi:thioredoxin-related protein